MSSDSMPETRLRTGDLPLQLYAKPYPRRSPMDCYKEPFKSFRARAAAFAAAFALSATLLIAIVGAFYSVASEPVLADSPQARSAVADCDARVDRVARQHCVRRLVASAKAHDAGASSVATLARHQRRRGE